MAKVSNVKEVADRLGITPRRVRQLTDDGVIGVGGDGLFNLDESERHYQSFVRHDVDSVCNELEDIGRTLSDGIARLKAAAPTDKAHLAQEIGPLVGKFDRTMALSRAMTPDQRPFLRSFADLFLGRVITEFMSAADVTLASEEVAP